MSQELRDVFSRFATGVTVIITQDPETGADVGLTCSSFSPVSLEPPMVLWSLRHEADCRKTFHAAKGYTINILSAQQKSLALQFSRGDQKQRFNTIDCVKTPSGRTRINGCIGWLDCTVAQIVEAGDHDIFLSHIIDFQDHNCAPGLIFADRQFGQIQHVA